MRVLVLSNMRPDEAHPERGRFVRDQVDALRSQHDLDLTLLEFPPGPRELALAMPRLTRRFASKRFDVIHSHFSLTAVPALGLRCALRGMTLHGTDVRHPRTRVVTLAMLPLIDVLVAVSDSLASALPEPARTRAHVIPCGVDLDRFRPIPRVEARLALGLEPDRPRLLFPADPTRPEKRYDLAEQLANAAGAPLMTLGGVPPERVPLLVNAANAVVVPSAAEGFGLAALEALSCDVPVLATRVGGHAATLAGVEGVLCGPFDLKRWLDVVSPHLENPNPRISGRPRASEYSAQRMASRLAAAWRDGYRRRVARRHIGGRHGRSGAHAPSS